MYSIWTDNGTEFEASFQMILKKRGIRHICSSPYNPEQNGKCEQYWRTLEVVPKRADVAALIGEYNPAPHFRLPQIERPRKMGQIAPLEGRNDPRHGWTPGVNPTWTVDGVSIPLL
jgi:transposase InsO family protein